MGLLSWLTGDGRDIDAMWDSFMRWLESQGADISTVRSTKSEFCSQFDKLPEPQNARALGLSMLMQERRDIWSAYSKFSEELSRYMV